MAVSYTPVTPCGGGKVHITRLKEPGQTACGRPCSGWKLAIKVVNCRACKLAVCQDARARGKR